MATVQRLKGLFNTTIRALNLFLDKFTHCKLYTVLFCWQIILLLSKKKKITTIKNNLTGKAEVNLPVLEMFFGTWYDFLQWG